MVVDDIEDNRTILTRRFERRGFRVAEAVSGLEALAMIESEPFDLVLLDVMMPGIDGFETLRRIRQTKSLSALPVIMVTAKSESQNIVDALDFGANDYITKPVDFAVALARVNIQIGRKQIEEQLAERTVSLIEANQTLKAEIANREKSEAHSKYLAYHDSLTGLGNRLMFREQLEQAINDDVAGDVVTDAGEFAVLFVDLDGFKGVNDSLGHSIGDLLLKTIASRLRDLLDPQDRIARLGGDEFAILQIGVAQPGASIALAEKIIAAIGLPCNIDGHDVSVGGSVGIAIGQSGTSDAERFLKSADIAMYKAKSDGRGTYRIFDPEMDAIVQARRILERDMRQALAQDGFQMHYQPLVNLQNGNVSSFEALMRWQHPERGMVSPGEFIPAAEEIGLIVPLGEWALRQACADAMGWPAEIGVSVNLSPIQFAKGNLVSTVVSALARSGLPASRLELEVTESVVLERSDRNLEILSQLRQLGVRISIDDFGTGYSGIGYLRSFQFDKIKIDQSFVRDLNEDHGSLAIVRAVIGLGNSFGITTTAEGVETEEQMRRLKAEGCIEAQGYLYSKPVPPDAIAQLLESLAARRTMSQDAAGLDLGSTVGKG
ncbi:MULTISPECIES: EAL domain-containing protein [Rhodopseudomonas]|uniref:putative bifunctional diguanylate cyclase/phosphodiesterase n=1 Tax=Rhodopseudomonas TaxID=1073 RepID=UPI00069766F6|nr:MULTISPECIES: EAL domain-containing protein [Rhodopseudomonas]MDF3812983.1 EAL domain-containing protein [Rhodopseudomonas sp. BAL398]WOK17501.1 EAL domain-containing protein [Rhodopseudomonas sp. BAL398]